MPNFKLFVSWLLKFVWLLFLGYCFLKIMRVALVHDYLNQYGGAEKVLENFSEIFPNAPIYTLIYSKKKMRGAFSNKEIKTSFLQKIPFAKSKHRIFPLLMPIATEQFDLSEYDLVLSDSASFSKGVITKPKTLHVCYCHTPPRYAWDDSHKYIKEFGMSKLIKKLIPFFMNYIRIWDKEAALRVDKFICNSNFVADRIKKYYRKNAKVIYPPVETDKFSIGNQEENKNYFLMVGRLLAYKKFDVAIQAFNKLGLPLKIIGSGPEKKSMQKIANRNIEFLGRVSNEQLPKYYQQCRALIFPQEEDFGIVALEAMSCGKPIIAYKGGGALESVKPEENGIFFNEQTPEALIKAINSFDDKKFNTPQIRDYALKFNKQRFKKQIKEFLDESYENYRN